jgi:hypothetical protein
MQSEHIVKGPGEIFPAAKKRLKHQQSPDCNEVDQSWRRIDHDWLGVSLDEYQRAGLSARGFAENLRGTHVSVFLQAGPSPKRPDCLPGVGGLELANVVLKNAV